MFAHYIRMKGTKEEEGESSKGSHSAMEWKGAKEEERHLRKKRFSKVCNGDRENPLALLLLLLPSSRLPSLTLFLILSSNT